jgi:hypothetical protein
MLPQAFCNIAYIDGEIYTLEGNFFSSSSETVKELESGNEDVCFS